MYTVALECVPSKCADAAAVLIALGEIDIASEEHVRGRARLDDGVRLAQKLDRWDLVGDAILAGGRFGFSPSRPDARERAALVQEVLAHLPETDVRRVVALSCWLAHLMVNVDARVTTVALDRAEELVSRGDDGDGVLAHAVAYARLRQLEAEAADPVACERAARALFADAVAAGDLVAAGLAGVARQAARLRRGDLAWDADREETRAVAERSATAKSRATSTAWKWRGAWRRRRCARPTP